MDIMTAARWVRVGPTRSMGFDGVSWGSAPAVTCGNTRSDTLPTQLPKLNTRVRFSSPAPPLTSSYTVRAAAGRSAERRMRVECALGAST